MTRKRKYLIKKVAEEGEDVKIDAGKFDALLEKLVQAKPRTNVDVVASRPKKADK